MLGAQPLVLERAPHDDQQLVDLERLLQVVERAELHRLDRALDRRVRRHHQDLRPLAFGRRRDVARESDRGRSAPASRCRRRARRTVRSASSRCACARAGRLDDVVAGVAQRAAERLQDLFLVVDEQDGAADACVMRLPRGRQREGRCGSRCRAPGALATPIVPPSPSTMFLAIGRPRPVPPRLVVKYGSKTCGRSAGVDAGAAIGDDDRRRDRRRARRASAVTPAARGRRRRGASPFTAWRALTSMLTSAMRSRSASVVDAAAAPGRGRA